MLAGPIRRAVARPPAALLVTLLIAHLSGPGAAQRAAAEPGGGTSLEALTQALEKLGAEHSEAGAGRGAEVLRELVAVAEERRALLTDLAETDPAAVLDGALSAADAAALPAGVRSKLERLVEVDGKLEILVEDGEGWSRLRHFVEERGERRALHFAVRPPALLSGERVRVRGVEVPPGSAGELAAVVAFCCDGTGVQALATAELPHTLGEQRTLVLLANFQNEASNRPLSVEQARSLVLGETSDYFRESSYGQTWLSGDVHGWFTLPLSSTSCSLSTAGDAADQAALQAGIDVSSYARVVYLFTNTACNVAGMATLGGVPSRTYVDGVFKARIVAHELGHNLGLHHSHALDCGGVAIGTECSSIEYGDSLDAMGNPDLGHFNAYQKLRLGWLGSGDSPPVTSVESDGTYTLTAYEPSGPGAKALRIPRGIDPVSGAMTWYYVEYRQALGFDGFLASRSNLVGRADVTHGLVVHLGSDADPNSSNLLHLHADSWYYRTYGWLDWFDPALPVGRSHVDADSGVTISAVSANGVEAQVAVQLDAAAQPVPPPPQPPPSNQAPVAVDDSASTSPDAAVTVKVLANDSDPEGAPLRVIGLSLASQGIATVDANSTVTYAPGSRAKGSDSFSYTVTDGTSQASAVVTIRLERSGGTSKGGGKR